MPERFQHYYHLSEKVVQEIIKNGIIALDANILLNIYRLKSSERDKLISILSDDNVRERVWIPHQAAEEFFKNRVDVMRGQVKSAKEFVDDLSKLVKDSGGAIVDEFLPQIAVDEIQEGIKDGISKYEFSYKGDPLFGDLLKLFDEIIGDELEEAALKEVIEEAKRRNENKIPPGYMDKAKDYPYGDYIIWKQLIEHSKKEKKHIVFVTEDRKEDWWYIVEGERVFARPELRKEFSRETGLEVLLWGHNRFIDWATKIIKDKIKKKDVEELKNELLRARKLRKMREEEITMINKVDKYLYVDDKRSALLAKYLKHHQDDRSKSISAHSQLLEDKMEQMDEKELSNFRRLVMQRAKRMMAHGENLDDGEGEE